MSEWKWKDTMEGSKWIEFADCSEIYPYKITKTWFVRTKDDGGFLLGYVKWLGRWRGYAFFPLGETIYEQQCLRDIANFIETENKKHRENRKTSKSKQATVNAPSEIG